MQSVLAKVKVFFQSNDVVMNGEREILDKNQGSERDAEDRSRKYRETRT